MNDVAALGLPGFPHDSVGPVFKEPWEARAFAMALRLHEGGLFTWSEWADALSQEIRAARESPDADHGDAYYQHWLRALEAMVGRKGAVSTGELDNYSSAWASAARRTPHGSPIELAPQDLKDR